MDKQNKLKERGKVQKIIIFTMAFLIFFPSRSHAQFYLTGDDPGKVRWSFIESPSYQIIYPTGKDSLATAYARSLEKFRVAVGRSAGYLPGGQIRCKMPVILHPFTSWSNGSVAWAPKRADLFTTPQAYGPDPLPWTDMLNVHESRHMAQMQFGLTKVLEPFNWFLGEMFNGATAGIYPAKEFLEGDAVVTETALSRAGRGRMGDFLNYYMIAFDKGDFRRWSRWVYGSDRYYTPDHYALGYLFLSGIRTKYDEPEYMGNYLDFSARRPWNFNDKSRYTMEVSGMTFNKTFDDLMRYHNDIWQKEIKERSPFMESRPFARPSRFGKTSSVYTEYRSTVNAGGRLFAIVKSFDRNAALVEILPSGKEKTICDFADMESRLVWSPSDNRLYWSEHRPDPRWSLAGNSAVRYLEIGKKKKQTLHADGKFFHPYPDPVTGRIIAAEYDDDGKTQMTVMDSKTGRVLQEIPVPEGYQIVEPAMKDGEIFFTAISKEGTGIYATDLKHPEHVRTIVEPSPVTIKNLAICGKALTFTSDRNGVDELYMAHSGKVFQLTNTRYGSNWHAFTDGGDSLVFSANAYDGRLMDKTASSDLPCTAVDFNDLHHYPVADELSYQERQLARAFPEEKDLMAWKQYKNVRQKEGKKVRKTRKWSDDSYDLIDTVDLHGQKAVLKVRRSAVKTEYLPEETENASISTVPTLSSTADTCRISAPEKYRKFPHLFNIHSWAPVYFSVDNIMKFSFDHIYEAASPGITALLQNRLGTFNAQIGYSVHKNRYRGSEQDTWKNSGHIKMTYTGLYPVFELKLDFNDRNRFMRRQEIDFMNGIPYSIGMVNQPTSTPYVRLGLSAHIPFTYASGQWQRGFVPEFSYTFTNDIQDKGFILNDGVQDITTGSVMAGSFSTYVPGKKGFTHQISARIRGWNMMPVTKSGVFPRFGIGGEVGMTADLSNLQVYGPGVRMQSPGIYSYLYGYLPGIDRKHGIRISALSQYKADQKALFNNAAVNFLPRGLEKSHNLLNLLAQRNGFAGKVSLDYAIPIFIGDLNIDGNILYIRRLMVTPHFDFSYTQKSGNLFSAGASIQLDLSAIFWIGVPLSIGVTYSYNGGSAFDMMKHSGIPMGHHYVGPVFSISLP